MNVRRVVTVAVVVLGALAVARSADAGIGDDVDLKLSKRAHGGFSGSVERSLQPGDVKNVYAKVKNDNPTSEIVKLYGPLNYDGYKFKYFNKNGTDITSSVIPSGHSFSIGSGKAKVFRARIKLPASADPDGVCPALSISWDDGAFFVYGAVRINEGDCA